MAFIKLYTRQKNLLHIILVCATLNLAACSLQPKVSQDYKPNTPYQHYQTFQIRQFNNDIARSDSDLIRSIIISTFEKQGLIYKPDSSDITLDINLLRQQAQQSKVSIGLGMGVPLGRHGSFGISSQQLLNNGDSVGLLIIDITDQQAHEVIWRGTANEIPMSYFFERNKLQLIGIIEDVLGQYPPK